MGSWICLGGLKNDTTPPTTPVIAATVISSSEIDISLTTPSTDAGGLKQYVLERSPNGSASWTTLATGLSIFTYADTGLSASTTYYYRATAYDFAGNTAVSSVVNATTSAGAGTPLASIIDSLYTSALAAARSVSATTYYVDPLNTTGAASNSNAGTSRSAPKLTMVNALAALSAGDELIVIGVGTVVDTTGVNVLTVGTGANGATWASGTSFSAMTIVRGETPFGLTFKYTSTGNIFGVGVCNQKGAYQWVDGVCFEVELFDEEAQYNCLGNHNRMTRVLYRSKGSAGAYAEYKQPLNCAGSNNLIQDCALAGVFRYGLYTGNGGSGGSVKQNVFRRVVVRCDGYDASGTNGQPHAPIACYGDNSSNNVVGEMTYQNVIVVDSVRASSAASNADSYTWGGFCYNPKITYGNIYQGCIGLNIETSRAGFMVNDNLGGTTATLTDCIGWDVKFSAVGRGAAQGIFAANSGGAGGTWSHLTGGNMTTSLAVVDDQSGATTLNSSLFTKYSGSQAILGAPSSTSYCAYENGDATGTNQVTFTSAPQWIVRTNYTTQGLGGGALGANVEKVYGAFCTHFGDTGYNQITTYDLWKYPYEDQIKTFFSVSTGTGTATRGFCTGTSVDGSSQTLTKYIWEYAIGGVQTQIPNGFY